MVPLNTASDPREAAGGAADDASVVGLRKPSDVFANVFCWALKDLLAEWTKLHLFIDPFIHAFIRSFVRSFFGVLNMGLNGHQGETLICLTKYPSAPDWSLWKTPMGWSGRFPSKRHLKRVLQGHHCVWVFGSL